MVHTEDCMPLCVMENLTACGARGLAPPPSTKTSVICCVLREFMCSTTHLSTSAPAQINASRVKSFLMRHGTGMTQSLSYDLYAIGLQSTFHDDSYTHGFYTDDPVVDIGFVDHDSTLQDENDRSDSSSQSEQSEDSDLEELSAEVWDCAALRSIERCVDCLFQVASEIIHQQRRYAFGETTTSTLAKLEASHATYLLNMYHRSELHCYMSYPFHELRHDQPSLGGASGDPNADRTYGKDIEALTHRLAETMTIRHNNFRRWRDQYLDTQEKLKAHGLPGALDEETYKLPAEPVLPMVTSAVRPEVVKYDNDIARNQIDHEGNNTGRISTIYSKEYWRELWMSDMIPELPRELLASDKFLCPFCYIPCAREQGSGQSWRYVHSLYSILSRSIVIKKEQYSCST